MLAPSAANRVAIARPIPEPAPVMTMAFPSRRMRSLSAWRVVGFQIAEDVLHAGEQVLEDGTHRVDALAVAERFVEHASLAFPADPAQAEVVIGARVLLERAVL